jgi:hypothetical protein
MLSLNADDASRFTALPLYRFTALPLYRFTALPLYRFTALPLYRFTALSLLPVLDQVLDRPMPLDLLMAPDG